MEHTLYNGAKRNPRWVDAMIRERRNSIARKQELIDDYTSYARFWARQGEPVKGWHVYAKALSIENEIAAIVQQIILEDF